MNLSRITMRLMALFLTCVTASNQSASAQSIEQLKFETGTDALAVCDSSETIYRTVCTAWLRGFLDGADGTVTIDYWLPNYCLSGGLKGGEAKTIFIDYLRKNPEDLNHTAPYLFRWALQEKFPCDRQAIADRLRKAHLGR